MLNEELELRKAANNLILVLMINEQLKVAMEGFEALLSISDFEQRMFENPAAMKSHSSARDALIKAVDGFKSVYGSSVISAAYEAFKRALSRKEFCAETGIETPLTKSEAATLFNKIFQELSSNVKSLPEETDGYAVFVEMVRETVHPTHREETRTDICPYCGGIPSRVSKTEFFGESTDDTDGYVWACECGAYAHLDEDGNVVGIIADKSLHDKRRKAKNILFDLLRLAGVAVFEGCKWFSHITEKRIRVIQDVEYLSDDQCELVFDAFKAFKGRLKKLEPQFPATQKELMAFLSEGGRFSALNAYGYKSGRLFIPIKVSEEAVRIRFRKTVQDIMLPRQLEYQFSGNTFILVHPTGKREKFKLFTKEQRQALYEEEKENV